MANSRNSIYHPGTQCIIRAGAQFCDAIVDPFSTSGFPVSRTYHRKRSTKRIMRTSATRSAPSRTAPSSLRVIKKSMSLKYGTKRMMRAGAQFCDAFEPVENGAVEPSGIVPVGDSVTVTCDKGCALAPAPNPTLESGTHQRQSP